MSTAAIPMTTRDNSLLTAIIKTGLAVGVSDGIFASLTGMLIPPVVTPLRVFRGVASVLIGKQALDGGLPAGLLGIGMHFFVATFWSTLFVLAIRYSPTLRDAINSNAKALLVAAVYGMGIWMFMSLVFIPAMVHRPPTITTKWWVQLIGHIPFVVGPMILVNRDKRDLPSS